MKFKEGQTILDRFTVESLHDEGGMAEVYRARHIRLGTQVALKVLYREGDEELVERFNREALMMSKVQHPNVVRIVDFGIVDTNLPCIAMEYVEGEPLDMRLVSRGALPWEECVEIMVGVLAGLQAIHEAHVLHRDLKPENIIVIPSEPEQVKLIDFGIAQSRTIFQDNLTQAGETVGTPAYMSPEQLYGLKLDPRSDVYSAALVLYELLTDKLPGAAETIKELAARIENPIPQPIAPRGLPPIPAELSKVVQDALNADPDVRPVTARQFEMKLRKIRRDERRKRHEARRGPRTNEAEPIPSNRDSAPYKTVTPDPRSASGPGGTPPPQPAKEPTPPPAGRPVPPPEHIDPRARVRTRAGFQRAHQSGSHAIQPQPAEVTRYVVVARLPRRRFKSGLDRQWLSEACGDDGLSFPVEPHFWVATVTGANDDAAASRAKRIAEAVVQRFGNECRTAYHQVEPGFNVSHATTHAGGALPPIIEGLIHFVSR